MSKKIIAIGGGDIAAKEMENVLNEMITLSGKEKPCVLCMAHSVLGSIPLQTYYYNRFKKALDSKITPIFLSSEELRDGLWDETMLIAKLDEADIIYEIGGNTKNMLEYWKQYRFDELLKSAYENGKIMSGFSAGANCWFEGCSSDYLKMMIDECEPFMSLDCLGFHEGFFIPHCDEADRTESAKEFLKENNLVGLFLSNGAALEIVDDKYRIITGNYDQINFKPYALKGYWQDNNYYLEKLDLSLEFKDISELLEKQGLTRKLHK